jgi:hypothetical protein
MPCYRSRHSGVFERKSDGDKGSRLTADRAGNEGEAGFHGFGSVTLGPSIPRSSEPPRHSLALRWLRSSISLRRWSVCRCRSGRLGSFALHLIGRLTVEGVMGETGIVLLNIEGDEPPERRDRIRAY